MTSVRAWLASNVLRMRPAFRLSADKILRILSFCAVSGLLFAQTGSTPAKSGVVVEWVTKNSEGERADVRADDVLVKWSRVGIGGEIESPSDLFEVEADQGPRGRVTLEGFRNGAAKVWQIGSNTWGINTRPFLPPDLLATYQEGQKLQNTGKAPEAAKLWQQAAAIARHSNLPSVSSFLLLRSAQLLFWSERWEEAYRTFQEAVDAAVESKPAARAELLLEWCRALAYRDNMNDAEKCYQRVLLEWRKLGDGTLAVSSGLRDLGFVALTRGDFDAAEKYYRSALTIAESLAPHSVQRSWLVESLGVIADERGDLGKAEAYYRQALAIEEEFHPGSHDVALTITNLGVLAHQRGDLLRAEAYHRKALKIAERLDSSNSSSADLLATILKNLGECLLDSGSPAKAEVYQARALSIRKEFAPGSLALADVLTDLGRIARAQGNTDKAEQYYGQALAIGEKIVPPPPQIYRVLIALGNLARENAAWAKAEEYDRRALGVMDKLAPNSLDHAETLGSLAFIVRKEGRPEAALPLYRQSLQALEGKSAQLGLEEDRLRYRAAHAALYKEYMDVLLDSGQRELAFEVLENSRARTLLETLSHAQVDIREGVEPGLLERERAIRRSLNAKSQYRIRMLTGKYTEAQLSTLDSELSDLLEQYTQVETEIRVRSPKYAALTQPQALHTQEIQRLLDPGTVLLEYALGEEHSYVWLMTEDWLSAYPLPRRIEVERLARQVYELLTVRNQVVKGESDAAMEARWAKTDAEFLKAARNLSKMVLGPVAGQLKGKRLVIVSDGALHCVPFAALPSPDRNNMLLLEEHEIVSMPSATVLAELRRVATARKPAPKAVAVLADPVFDASDERLRGRSGKQAPQPGSELPARRGTMSLDPSSELITRSAADLQLGRNGRSYLNRLIYSRQEAESIMAVTPARQGMLVLDFDANRSRASSSELAQYRIVHFATHGLLDGKHPELSGLVFSMVDRRGKPQAGFLQLQDIYNLNLPVELVVLSACETGLGEQINGEGLIGLTRGFMYAGASRVVASLWSVSDVATSELMARFYKAMEQGKQPPAAALRSAQIQMLRQKRWQSPYYWAAFQLQGEWR